MPGLPILNEEDEEEFNYEDELNYNQPNDIVDEKYSEAEACNTCRQCFEVCVIL